MSLVVAGMPLMLFDNEKFHYDMTETRHVAQRIAQK